jgi:hypothetical protein
MEILQLPYGFIILHAYLEIKEIDQLSVFLSTFSYHRIIMSFFDEEE